MPLRADQWLMLGVVGLGGYAVYRLTQTTSSPPPPDSPLNLPVEAGSPSAAPPGFPLLGDPVHLTNSRAYRGRIELGRGGLPANMSREQIESALVRLGFDAIRVYEDMQQAAPTFPAFALHGAGRGTRWFYGRWLGPTTDTARPAFLSLLWVARGLTVRDDVVAGVLYPRRA